MFYPWNIQDSNKLKILPLDLKMSINRQILMYDSLMFLINQLQFTYRKKKRVIYIIIIFFAMKLSRIIVSQKRSF